MDEKKRRGEQARFDKNSREGFLEKGREEEEKEKEFPLKKWMRPKKRSFIERSLEKPSRFSKKKKNADKVNAIFLMRRIFIFSINFLESSSRSQNYFTNNWKLALKKEKKDPSHPERRKELRRFLVKVRRLFPFHELLTREIRKGVQLTRIIVNSILHEHFDFYSRRNGARRQQREKTCRDIGR